ncbi:MAG: hypothetical protein J6M34_03625 [Clostridia bacterium]|nr:hypothetical protein [Clostridia bacterium]
MCKKRFLALFLAILMLCLTACTDTGTDTPSVGNSNSVQGTETVSSDQNGVGIPEVSDGETSESGSETVSTDGMTEAGSTDSGINSDQPTQPSGTTGDNPPDTPTNSETPSNPDTSTDNGNTSSEQTPTSDSNSSDGDSSNDENTSSEPSSNPGSGSTPSNPPAVEPARYGKTWLGNQTNGAQMVKVYEEIVAGAEKMSASISLSGGISESEISKIWTCYRDDYPEHFWLANNYSYSIVNKKIVSVSPNYTMNATQKASAQAAMEAQITALLNGLSTSMSQYDLEKAIHDRLILHTTYTNVDFCHTAYGALVNGKAVCDGYSRAFQLLCRRMGLDVLIVRGKSNNPTTGVPEGHAWNLIKIDGNYYHIDVTWGDAGEPTADYIHYGWFNVPTAQIQKDHIIETEGYDIPNCTATAQNYYRKNNAYLSTLTVDGLVAATKKVGTKTFICKVYVENPGDFNAWIDANIDTLADRYGLNGYSFTMTTAGNELQYQFN